MFDDLLVYTTPKLQHAHMVLALLQIALKKAGLTVEAKRIEGLDLTNPEMAKIALQILRAMNVQVKDVHATHLMAVQAIEDAIKSEPLTINN